MEETKLESLKNGYSICLNKWTLDNRIKNELNLLLLISSLCAATGQCYALNNYFSEVFGIDEATVSRKINKLKSLGYIEVEYIYKNKEVVGRNINIMDLQKYQGVLTKKSIPIDKKVKDKSISNNNTLHNIYATCPETKNKKFVPPTVDEVKKYCQDNGYDIDAEYFIKYYEANEWKDSRNEPVRNWKQRIITWAKKNKTNNNNSSLKPQKEENVRRHLTDEEIVERIIAYRRGGTSDKALRVILTLDLHCNEDVVDRLLAKEYPLDAK